MSDTITINAATKKDLIDRAEAVHRLETQQASYKEKVKEVKEQIDAIYAKAAEIGHDKAALKRAIKELGMEADKRQAVLDLEAVTDRYREALGLETLLNRFGDGVSLPPSPAEKIYSAMSEGERAEATELLAKGEDIVTAVTTALAKRAAPDASAARDDIEPPRLSRADAIKAKADQYAKDQKKRLKAEKASAASVVSAGEVLQ